MNSDLILQFLLFLVGNVGNVFAIDNTLGIISVSKTLQRDVQSDYDVVVRAVDGGTPSLTSTVHVFVTVTVSDNAPPKFEVNLLVTLILNVKYFMKYSQGTLPSNGVLTLARTETETDWEQMKLC